MGIEEFKCKVCKDRSCAVAILNETELEKLSTHLAQVKFAKGESLFKQDTLNGHIIYIRQGLVKVHMRVSDQKDLIFKIVPAPAYLGLPTVFGDCVNRYSITALEPTTACCINVDTFKELIFDNGRFAYGIIEDICKEELCNFRNYLNQSTKQVPGRLAGALIYFSQHVYKNDHFKLSLTRTELAELIGTSRENVTRNLYDLKNAGIIDIQRNGIRILKPDRLQLIYEAG